MIRVERRRDRLAEYGPGAMLGERAALEGGTRTSTLVAVTPCRVASVPAVQLDLSDLAELATGHRREDAGGARLSGARPPVRRPRLDARAGRGVRPLRRPHLVRGHRPGRRAPDGAAPRLILDAGTGLRRVTGLLGGAPFAGTILLTHLHWDHVHGLPFFTAGDRDDARVTLLLPEQEERGAGAEEVLARGMSPPHFPIAPGGLRGDWTFGTLAPGVFKAEGFTVEAREVPHKGGRTFGYRVSDGHSAMAYIPDHCPTALGPGPEGWGEYHPAALSPGRGRGPADPRRVPAAGRGRRRGLVRPPGGGLRGRPGPPRRRPPRRC